MRTLERDYHCQPESVHMSYRLCMLRAIWSDCVQTLYCFAWYYEQFVVMVIYKHTWAFTSGMSTRTSSPLPSSIVIRTICFHLVVCVEVMPSVHLEVCVCLCMHVHVNGRDVTEKITLTIYLPCHNHPCMQCFWVYQHTINMGSLQTQCTFPCWASEGDSTSHVY